MSRAFVEREAAPHVAVAPCLGCGAASESPLCEECDATAGRAAEHPVACRCPDCRLLARALAAGVAL